MILGLFTKKEKKIDPPSLDERVGDLLDKALDNAENHFDFNPVRGLNYLRHANELYNLREDKLGVDVDRLCRLNRIFRRYIELYFDSREEDYQ